MHRVESPGCHQMEPAGSRLNSRLLPDTSGSDGSDTRGRGKGKDDLSVYTRASVSTRSRDR
jgi:hypothetical protein